MKSNSTTTTNSSNSNAVPTRNLPPLPKGLKKNEDSDPKVNKNHHDHHEKIINDKSLSNDDEWILLGRKRQFRGINSFTVFPGQSLLFVTAIPESEAFYQENVKSTLEPCGKIDKSGAYLYTTVSCPNNSQFNNIPLGWKDVSPQFIRVTHEFDSVMPILKRKREIGSSEKNYTIIQAQPLSKELIALYTQPTEWLNYDNQVMKSFLQKNDLLFNPAKECEVAFTMRALKTLHKFVTYQQGLPFVDTCCLLNRGKGDCGSFSNALASILRANKIPSRAAVGLGANKMEKKPLDYEAMDINYQQYHCMCQVYFKNLGWHLIEATLPDGVEHHFYDVFVTKHFDAVRDFEMGDISFKSNAPVSLKYEWENSLTKLIDWNLEMKLLQSNEVPKQFNKTLEFLQHIYRREINKCFAMLSNKLFQDNLTTFQQYLCESHCPKEGNFVVMQDLIECSICNGTKTLKIWCSMTEITGLYIAETSTSTTLEEFGFEKPVQFKLLQSSYRKDMKNNFLDFQKKYAGEWHVDY